MQRELLFRSNRHIHLYEPQQPTGKAAACNIHFQLKSKTSCPLAKVAATTGRTDRAIATQAISTVGGRSLSTLSFPIAVHSRRKSGNASWAATITTRARFEFGGVYTVAATNRHAASTNGPVAAAMMCFT